MDLSQVLFHQRDEHNGIFLFCVMWVMPFCVMGFFCVMWVMPATNLENSIGWEDKVRAAQRAAHRKSSVA